MIPYVLREGMSVQACMHMPLASGGRTHVVAGLQGRAIAVPRQRQAQVLHVFQDKLGECSEIVELGGAAGYGFRAAQVCGQRAGWPAGWPVQQQFLHTPWSSGRRTKQKLTPSSEGIGIDSTSPLKVSHFEHNCT